jgi:hypothetical protein
MTAADLSEAAGLVRSNAWMSDGSDHDEQDLAAERLLRAARPRPDERFVRRTERRLLGRSPHERRRQRTLVAGAGLSGALASAFVVAGLTGSGPLAGNDGGDAARARDRCKTVQVTTTQQVGEVVRDARGKTKVVIRERPVTRAVTRCR